MITNIAACGDITISTAINQPYAADTTNKHIGEVSFNFSTNQFEIYNGSSNVPYYNTVDVSLSPYVNDAIKWVHNKMAEERELQTRMEKYPALKKAYDNFIIIDQLTKDGENINF